MLLKRRAPGIEHRPATITKGFEHLDDGSIAVLRWLLANEVDFVLVGALAQSLRGRRDAQGPVAIVPAPYHRNYARLARALQAAHARQRVEPAAEGQPDTAPIKLTADKLAEGQRWELRCEDHDVDIEPVSAVDPEAPEPGPGYQELRYEAARIEPIPGVAVEVASPEDLEHYAQVAPTTQAPAGRVAQTPSPRDNRS